MKNKKGFTLIELLAVIVILAIIALIATPIILNMINQAKKNAAKSAALGYVDAIEYNNGFAQIESPGYTAVTGTDLDVTNINIKVKGKKPSSGTVTVNSKGKVTSASNLCFSGYKVNYDGKDATVNGKCNSSSNEQANNNNKNQQNVPAPKLFATDSWETIANNTTSDKYHVGDEREIELDMDNNGTPESYTLRLANNTTPSVCSTEGYSQTACGFVIEFVDVVDMRKMNEEYTNVGGWKETEMVTYLNGDFYNKLPSDLKEVIIPTYPIVSGSGSSKCGGVTNTSENIISTDTTKNKLYLLSGREIGKGLSHDNKKDVTTDTRVLDYYDKYKNSSYKIKRDLNNTAKEWWLRSAGGNCVCFYWIMTDGRDDYINDRSRGVAPAFRVGVNS